MSSLGRFFGIGVGPGPAGLIPVAALDALQRADVIFAPRAKSASQSLARRGLAGAVLAASRIREIEFNMDTDRSALAENYARLADTIAQELRAGRSVAYLTIGDSMTYSTYGYLLTALLERLPGLAHRSFPGVTSYSAIAAALGWPLGEGKERMLILPCPDDIAELRRDIEQHDVVVLMKIGRRLPAVLALVREMGIAQHCAFGGRIGLPGERLCSDLNELPDDASLGYLATMLIRRNPRDRRGL